MSLNKITLRPERRLINTIKTQSRNIRELKTPQKIGADVLQVQSLPTAGSVYSVSISLSSGGGEYPFLVSLQPDSNTLTLWNLFWTLYIDPTSFSSGGIPDAQHQWPLSQDTSFLTPGQLNFQLHHNADWANSSDSTNGRVWKFWLINNDTSVHTYYLFFKAYLPNLNQT